MAFFRIAVIIIFFFCVLPAAIHARNIEIVVEDSEIGLPLEGAMVSLRNGERFVCDGNGIARVQLPDYRQTIVQVSYPGYNTLRLTIPASPPQGGAPQPQGIERFTALLRLGGVMIGRELVIEASRPETSETRPGRSVAITERELARTAEIGIIEDVMSSVKLLPGVGYTGMFGALPSIRGGDPGDMTAVFDGFYLERPFHWVGAVSIFDPKMVSSARLSHGVFSARYGHTISGLLEIASKSPSSAETELETAVSTSAASINLSLPMNGKGGILFMGKVTYWDTLVWAAQGLSRVIDNESLDMINYVTTAPYIRSAAVAANYRFGPETDWRLNFFFGSDGIGAEVHNEYDNDDTWGSMDISADYDNYQGFLISGITASPSPVLAIKATGGIGFMRTITDSGANNNITARYHDDFVDDINANFPSGFPVLQKGDTYTAPDVNVLATLEHNIFNAQLRGDLDWDLGKGFIAAFGLQGLYSLWAQKQDIDLFLEFALDDIPDELQNQLPPGLQPFLPYLPDGVSLIHPMKYKSDITNHGFTSSAYALVEYTDPGQRFGMEAGLRLDHLYISGKDFRAYTLPAFNPRFNFDVNIMKNKGFVDSFDFTIGTGFFSSINPLISFLDKESFKNMSDVTEIRFDRSLTSILGFKLDFAQSYSFNIEGYYKRIFNRAYITADVIPTENIVPEFLFDGIGNVWGFDLQLQKLESRFWDGWISYTFTWAKYHDPSGGGEGVSMGSIDTNELWYYPSFHRFHNANIVLNFKPFSWFTIATRFGLASGQPTTVRERGDPYYYPVMYIDDDGINVLQKYRRDIVSEKNSRSSWTLPWDLKLSFFRYDRKGRVGTEMYLAAENLMSVFSALFPQTSSTRFNEYTGVEDTSGTGGSGMFDLPVPLISFGFKWRY